MENSIVIRNLSHKFGETFAIREQSYDVKQGEIFALLGPNGAGKTTTIRLINGLYAASAGDIRVLGLDPRLQGSQVRQQCGVLTETSALYENLTASENLLFFGRLYRMPESALIKRTDEILEFFALKNRKNDRVATYSKGMKQRLALARAFLAHPRILFLDEPTSSLDPESAQQVHELIATLQRQGECTVFLCTHRLEEAERLAERVAILHNGELVALGTINELAKHYSQGLWVEIDLAAPLKQEFSAANLRGVLKETTTGTQLKLQIEEEDVIPAVVNELVAHQARIMRVSPLSVSLEDIYFKIQSDAKEGSL